VVGNNSSTEKPAGIVAQVNSAGLNTALTALNNPDYNAGFSRPRQLDNNIIWHNRAFHLGANATNTAVVLLPELTQGAVGDCGSGATYWDLGVLDTSAFKLNPTYSVLSALTDHDGQNYTGDSNSAGDPNYGDYCNGSRVLSAPGPIQVFLGTGEGGNFVDVRFGPLVNKGDYHLTSASAVALDNGTNNNAPAVDIDGDDRPQGVGIDLGADEYVAP
jgi:hypothetical protein